MTEMDTAVIVVAWKPTGRSSLQFNLNLANKMLKVDPNVSISFHSDFSLLHATSSEEDRTFAVMWPTDRCFFFFFFDTCSIKTWNSNMQNHGGGVMDSGKGGDFHRSSIHVKSIWFTHADETKKRKETKDETHPEVAQTTTEAFRTSRGQRGVGKCICTMVLWRLWQLISTFMTSPRKGMKVEPGPGWARSTILRGNEDEKQQRWQYFNCRCYLDTEVEARAYGRLITVVQTGQCGYY